MPTPLESLATTALVFAVCAIVVVVIWLAVHVLMNERWHRLWVKVVFGLFFFCLFWALIHITWKSS